MKTSSRRSLVPLVLVAAADAGRRLHHDPRVARRPGPAPRPVGELEPQGLQFQRGRRPHGAQARRDDVRRHRAAARAAQRRQLLRQLRRRLVGDQQHPAGQDRARLRRLHAGGREHALRAVRHPRRRQRDGSRASQRRLRTDPRPLRRRRRRLRRLPILGPSTVRDTAALPIDRLASPPAFFDSTATQIELTVLQIVNTRAACSARPGDRRDLARQVHLRARRLPAAPTQPDLRRRCSRRARGPRRLGLRCVDGRAEPRDAGGPRGVGTGSRPLGIGARDAL